MAEKLNIAFLWHMHQPYYRDPKSGKYVLPWVRLHGIKGYIDMIEAVRRYGGKGVTFNLVPCLLEQLEDIASGTETDLYFEISKKRAQDLELADKKLILQHFFSAQHDNMIFPFPRYRELLYRRNQRSLQGLDGIATAFSEQDYRDLQVWFNLTWFGWAAQERHPIIRELRKKGRKYTEDEKDNILALQLEVLREVIPAYRDAWEKGIIEISTTPYYHPILPLIIDNRCAKISQPNDPLPIKEFSHPNDARSQLERGREFVKKTMGKAPAGLWPSEGSVSPAVCEMAGEVGFEWLATDENVLKATFGSAKREEILYSSYKTDKNGPVIFFRDQYLSDSIGFRYSRNTPRAAVDDLISHLENIAASRISRKKRIVSIILDGENAWEYFSDGGQGFLKELYMRLNDHARLKLITFSDYIRKNPPEKVLPPIFPASWISGSFRIWIGDPLKNQAWDRLAETATAISEKEREKSKDNHIRRAREWLHIAEGSDWFWWYGEPNHSDFEEEFDHLFRSNLMQVYRELDLEVPSILNRPISKEGVEKEETPIFIIKPVIDGRITTYYEWIGARRISAGEFSGSMNFTSSLLQNLFYGISEKALFLRLDKSNLFAGIKNMQIVVQFCDKYQSALEIKKIGADKPNIVWKGKKLSKELPQIANNRIIEVEIPFSNLHKDNGDILFAVIIMQDNLEIERWPREGCYTCPWPTEDYLAENWVV